jgi:hypothetical protein
MDKRFEIEVFVPKLGKYNTHNFASKDAVKRYIKANRAKIDNYELSVCSIREVTNLNLEDFGL